MIAPQISRKSAFRWAVVLLAVAAASLFARGIEVREDALDLLPSEAVRHDTRALQRLGVVDRVFVSLEAQADPGEPASEGPPARLLQSCERLGRALSRSPHFSEVVYRFPDATALLDQLWSHLPVLMSAADLQQLEPRLTAEAVRKALTEDFLLLTSPAGLLLKEQILRDPLAMAPPLLHRLRVLQGDGAVTLRDGFLTNRAGDACLLWARSAAPLTDSFVAEEVAAVLNQAADESLLPGVTMTVVGSLPHTLSNAHLVRHDLGRLLPVAVVALVVLLLGVLRDLRAVLVVAVPFLAIPIAIALLRVFYHQVSAISLGFGIALLGICVDFALHLFMALSREPTAAALARLRRPVALAATTTVGVFAVLLLSDVPVHRQMAVLAAGGMSAAVAITWWLVPTLVGGGGAPTRERRSRGFVLRTGWGGVRLAGWGACLLLGLWAWPHLHYNGDLKTFDHPTPEIQRDEARFHAQWETSGDRAFLLARGRDLPAALDVNDEVYAALRSRGVSDAQSVAPLLPGPRVQARHRDAWRVFWGARRAQLTADLEGAARELGFAPDAFAPFLAWLEAEAPPLEPRSLLASPLAPLLGSLVSPATGDGGPALVATLVRDAAIAGDEAAALEATIDGVRVVSASRWRHDVEALLKSNSLRLSLTAGALTLFLLALALRRPRPVMAASAPVLSAVAAIGLFGWATGGEINPLHVLMGVMVIGLSVDYGVFIVSAAEGTDSGTTFLAVTLCAASTMTGFGVLALADHPALYTLGTTVLAGIGAAWVTALWITPLLLGAGRGDA